MSDNKSYRVHTNINEDKVLNINLQQDYDIIEVLSLKLSTENVYKFHTSDYGCVAGRVLANGNFGIPNAKISIFIAIDEKDKEDDILSYLYPYTTTRTKNSRNVRYNLLPEDQLSDCHRNVGTFPSKRMVLDDNNVLEVYDKYYKFTTRSNEAGDYMIFGVPTGEQMIHVDIDLSDIGILSQRPRDMIYKGYNMTQFENANMFKKSDNLDSLTQIITQNQTIYVYPFWGEKEEGDIAISRRDIEVQYDFTPTCVFMGSLITDERSSGISKRCIPSERMGQMDKLTTGKGTIEMIRKKQDGSVEEIIVQGNELIDGNGVWCYQIPMNLDYVRTDEYGNIVPTDDPEKGIPTRTKARFRFSLTEFENETDYSHLSKVLVPNNPTYATADERDEAIRKLASDERKQAEAKNSQVIDYVFGTNTDENSFKDLFWNNVYTVKSYIPRIQMLNIDRNKRFSGIKAVNVNNGNNPIPYNNMRVDLTFVFRLQCAVFHLLLWIVSAVNKFYTAIANTGICSIAKEIGPTLRCLYIGDGYCPEMEGWYFAPNCAKELHPNKKTTIKLLQQTLDSISGKELYNDAMSIASQNNDKNDEGASYCITNNIQYFVQCVEMNFAMENGVIQFDFYNDWMNGMIYMPRWFALVRPKRTFLFGAIKRKEKIVACMESAYKNVFARRYVQQCAMEYGLDANGKSFTNITTPKGCKNETHQKCHLSKGRQFRKIFKDTKMGGGLVHDELTMKGEYAYYLRPCEWVDNNNNFETKCNLFTTDIVLIGSMDEVNSMGIPQTFKKLASSSYQLPDALASTNLGVDGLLYGIPNGSVCSGINETGVEPKSKTFGGVEQWTRGKDFYEDTDMYDPNEYAVTEVAGIDWGFPGPNQGENDNENDNEKSNNLYYPGGHFLGMSCFNAQTNIKSCVNLSRICEMGTLMSQRQAIVRRDTSSPDGYSYSYLIPTGLISGDEINDYGFRNEFATLNYNGLRTKINFETGLLEYDFETLHPINFNGDLKNKVNNDKYNQTKPKQDDETGAHPGISAYTRTIEENNEDYYRFRFNLHGDYTANDAKKKYLNVSGNKVSLPVYENSFYFYFGLKNGDTALDRFYEEFFAECPSIKGMDPAVIVNTKQVSVCEGGTGTAEVEITTLNLESPTFFLNGVEIPTAGADILVTALTVGEYTVAIESLNFERIEKTFEIRMKYPDIFDNLEYDVISYTEEITDPTDHSHGGYIQFRKNPFAEDSHLRAIYMKNDKLVTAGITGNTITALNWDERAYGWGGNSEYYLEADYVCENGTSFMHKVGKFTLEMPLKLDLMFGGNGGISYNLLKEKYNVSRADWYVPFLINSSDSGSVGTPEEKLAMKKLLFYQNSMCGVGYARGKMTFTPKYGEPPYTIELKGGGEKMELTEEEGKYLISLKYFPSPEAAATEGFDLNMNDFIIPTQFLPEGTGYTYDYELNGVKTEYELAVRDTKGSAIALWIPSIYLPFFFCSLFVNSYVMKNGKPISYSYNYLAAANGITKNGTLKDAQLGNKVWSSLNRQSNWRREDYKEDYNYSGETNYPTMVTGSTAAVSKDYMASVSDEFSTISRTVSRNFVGDSDVSPSSDIHYYKVYENVGYFENATVVKQRGSMSDADYIDYTSTYKETTANRVSAGEGYVWNPLAKCYLRTFTQLTEDEIRYGVSDPQGTYSIIGVYDSDFDEESEKMSLARMAVLSGDDEKAAYYASQLEPRHISTLSILKIYDIDSFNYFVRHNG